MKCAVCGVETVTDPFASRGDRAAGVKFRAQAPYGSRFDTDVFELAICDDCLEAAHTQSRLHRESYTGEIL